jgi:A/G-specific adenine glycosylase
MTPEQGVQLLEWYARDCRLLPWRADRDPYRVLVSELMLQQTTVAAVIPKYERWMRRFPTLQTLAGATPEEVIEAWSGLGYYSRARRLHQAALHLHEHGYPDTLDGWLELPGLGPYTAAAVASIAFGLPHLALDTNALRVLLRLYGWELRPDDPRAAARLRERVEGGVGGADFGLLNQAIMEVGATLCKPRDPACLLCPLAAGCQARERAVQNQIPAAKPRTPLRQTVATAYLLPLPGGGVLLVRGTPVGLLQDLYQPPLSFAGENPPGHSLTALLDWLDKQPSCAAGTLSYGISGRRLTVRLRQCGPGLASEAEKRAAALAIPAIAWPAGSPQALSSLTRKILKVWEGSRSSLRPQDESCLGSEP